MGATVVQDPSNPGFSAWRRISAVLLGAAPFILLINPDAIIEPSAISVGLEILTNEPLCAAVQGVIVDRSTGEPERSSGRLLNPLHLWGRSLGLRRLLKFELVRRTTRRIPAVADHVDRSPSAVTEVESLSATAALVRRAAFEAVGGFDERFFLYAEDMDLSRRLRRVGWTLYAATNDLGQTPMGFVESRHGPPRDPLVARSDDLRGTLGTRNPNGLLPLQHARSGP